MNENKQQNEDIAERMEKKVEKWVRENIEVNANKIGHIIAIVVLLIIMWVTNNATKWNYSILDFVKPEFDSILWIINLSFVSSIIGEIVAIYTKNKKIKGLAQIIENIFSFIVIINYIKIYPFDFTELIDADWTNNFVKFAFRIALFGVAMGTIVEFLKLLPLKDLWCKGCQKTD